MVTLQDKVINYLLALIEQSQHDTPLPSQNELRQKFDCSTMTVRKALEKLEERGLIYRIQGKGCFVRRTGSTATHVRIFLIISPRVDLQGTFVSSLVEASRNHSYHTLFYCYDDNEDMLFYEIDRLEPQVVLWLAPSVFKHGKTLQKLLARPLHVILFNREYDHPAVSYVSGDFTADGRAIGKKLLESSAKEVLYVSFDMRFMFSHLRATGLSEVITDAGGNVTVIDAHKLCTTEHNGPTCRKTEQVLYNAIVEELQKKQYSAVVGAQGRLWPIISQVCRDSIADSKKLYLGNFNAPESPISCDFPVIVIEQPIAEMADEAIQLVARLLKGGDPERILYHSKFNDGQS